MRAFALIIWIVGCGSSGPTPMDLSPAAKKADPGTVGAACQADGDCTQAGASCILPDTNQLWSGGYCTVKNCPTTQCPDGSYCQEGHTALGATTCLFECTSDDDCRSSYKCCDVTQPSGTGVKVCAPKSVLCS